MSPYEQGTGSNVLGGGGSRLPMGGNTDCGQRDSGYLAVSNVSVGGRLDKTGAVAGRCPGDEAVGKPRSQGVCEPALEPWRRGKGLWRKSQDFKPDRGNPAVRHYRGATGNVAMVGMRTRLAIERAGTVTPHLKRGAPVLYPNPNGNGEQTDRPDLRSNGASPRPYKSRFSTFPPPRFLSPENQNTSPRACYRPRPRGGAPRRFHQRRLPIR